MLLFLSQVELPAGVSRIKSVSCGGSHTLALDSEGRVLCCGKNEAGRLGLGDSNANRLTFEVLQSLFDAGVKVERLEGGGSHSLFLSTEVRDCLSLSFVYSVMPSTISVSSMIIFLLLNKKPYNKKCFQLFHLMYI